MSSIPVSIAIMAGGGSRRMGADQPETEFDGHTLLETVALAALGTGLPVMVIGRSRPARWVQGAVEFVHDEVAGLGPLGGLATALRRSPGHVLATACDLPQLTPAAFAWLLGEAAGRAFADGLVTFNGDRLEPLFAIYTNDCLPRIDAQLTTNRHALWALIEAGDFERVDAPSDIGACLRNVNPRVDGRRPAEEE